MEADSKQIDNIHAGHRQRMLETYLKSGAEALSDVEILELLMGFAIARRDVNPIAHALLREFGSLHRVFEVPAAQLTRVPGVGPRTAALLRLCAELWGRCEQSRSAGARFLRSTQEIGQFLVARTDALREERAWLLCLDGKCRVLAFRELCRGAANAVNLPYRKLVETALLESASSVILAHNHINGTLIPSLEDVEYTRGALRALELVDVVLADHFILGGRSYTSMRASNMLKH